MSTPTDNGEAEEKDMPVSIEEIVRIKKEDGTEIEGPGLANNLVAVKDGDSISYGQLLGIVRINTTIICDNPKCDKGLIDHEFVTHPKVIQFSDNGDNSNEFIRDVSGVVITSDYKGEKLAFCSHDCNASYSKKIGSPSKVSSISTGKGKKTQFNLEEIEKI